MVSITHNIALSTTETNLVGDIRVRQADDETQLFEVTVLENGTIKNFAGLKPFFCLMAREITGQGVSEEPVADYDGSKGTLKYTVSANAMQMVGRNEAYFSFRKELSNGEWAEQFSTRLFYYTVEKSIYTQQFKDSNYWFTFKELYRLFNEYMSSGKGSWESFVEDNREILESIDPGGAILTELIDSRGDFNRLGERLDQWDASINQRSINVKDFGAVGDNMTDDTQAIANALATAKIEAVEVIFPAGQYKMTWMVPIYSNTKLKFLPGARLMRHTTNGDGFFTTGERGVSDFGGTENIEIEGGIFDGNPAVETWGYSSIGVALCKNLYIHGATFLDGITSHFLDIADSEDVIIENCKFLGYRDKSPEQNRDYVEAIQLGVHQDGWSYNILPYTGKGNRNISIRNCEFGNSDTEGSIAYPHGIGDHTGLNDQYTENVVVEGCTFNGCDYGIFLPKFNRITIRNNKFDGCKIGVHARGNLAGDGTTLNFDGTESSQSQAFEDLSIENNQFIGSTFADIEVWGGFERTGAITEENIAISKGIVVKGNISDGAVSRFINPKFVSDIEVKDNIVKNCGMFLYQAYCQNLMVSGNKIKNAKNHVFNGEGSQQFSNKYSKNHHYANNSIIGAMGSAFHLIGFSGGTVIGNYIEDVGNWASGQNGITVNSDVTDVTIGGNKGPQRRDISAVYGVYINSAATNIKLLENSLEGKTASVGGNPGIPYVTLGTRHIYMASNNTMRWMYDIPTPENQNSGTRIDANNGDTGWQPLTLSGGATAGSGPNEYRAINVNDLKIVKIRFSVKNVPAGIFATYPAELRTNNFRGVTSQSAGKQAFVTASGSGLYISQPAGFNAADEYSGEIVYMV